MEKGKIWVIPTPLGDHTIHSSLSAEAISVVQHLKAFIVENEKVARKFLREVGIKVPQSAISVTEFGKHVQKPIGEFFTLPENGQDIGLLSDAGCPGIADPGSEIVLEAHIRGYQVCPLVGPSSIVLGLMASGFNGQSFVFHGYLPIDRRDKREKLKQLEMQSEKLGQTQIFIETPYRNRIMIDDMIEALRLDTLVCIAAGITTEQSFIQTKTVRDWKQSIPSIEKIPAIFLIQRSR